MRNPSLSPATSVVGCRSGCHQRSAVQAGAGSVPAVLERASAVLIDTGVTGH